MLQPLAYEDPEALINITVLKGTGGVTPDSFVASGAELLRWKRNRQLAGVGGLRPTSFALTGDAEPRTITGALVSAGLFTTLGVPPQRGRTFTEAEDVPNAPVVVISHDLWASAFNGDPAAIGRTLIIDGIAREVIGIMPPGYKPLFRASARSRIRGSPSWASSATCTMGAPEPTSGPRSTSRMRRTTSP